MQSSLATQGSAAIPEAEHRLEPSSKAQIDEALEVLTQHKQAWADASIDDRIDLLDALREGVARVAEEWVEASLQGKGIDPGSPYEAEEWLGGPAVLLRNIQLLQRSLRDFREHGAPCLPKPAFLGERGQVVAPVLPADGWDSFLFRGFKAEVWMQPEVRLEELEMTQAVFYREQAPVGKVALVLGAGNVSSIAPMDSLYKLFVEGQVVLLKMNPVNEYLGPILSDAFEALQEHGFFRIVYGGATEGEYMCQHPRVEEIHMTGSDKTHDAIVYGTGEEGAKRKTEDRPRLHKPLSSELGNVSPVIIVPGPWSDSDLAFQAENIASSLCNNAGFNCNAPRVIVQHAQWEKREVFLGALRGAFRKAEERHPYYPGAEERHRRYVEEHPYADQFGASGPGQVPWTLITHLNPEREDEICFTSEAWCGVTSEVGLSASSAVDYLERAVAFCNDKLWGTLAAQIIVHPRSLQDPAMASAVERAIGDLRYGGIAVNHWPGVLYGMASPTWGSFPGHPRNDIRSGSGVVHNTYMFDRAQKSVLRGPFRLFPKPPWFLGNRNAVAIGRQLTYFYADPSLVRLPGLLWTSLKG